MFGDKQRPLWLSLCLCWSWTEFGVIPFQYNTFGAKGERILNVTRKTRGLQKFINNLLLRHDKILANISTYTCVLGDIRNSWKYGGGRVFLLLLLERPEGRRWIMMIISCMCILSKNKFS